jgi:protein involved in polysaccharide export with SLBB domain
MRRPSGSDIISFSIGNMVIAHAFKNILNMNVNYLKFLFIGLFFAIASQNAFAQTDFSSLKVDQMSDAQVQQIIKEGDQHGYNEDQTISMAVSMGLSKSEAEKLRKRIDDLNSRASQQNNTLSGLRSAATIQPSLSTVDTTPQAARIFGSQLFRNSSISFEPDLRIATPRNYIIGPDDELLIDISGNNEASYKLKVSPEGTIRMQYVGTINVVGLTVEQAAVRIRKQAAKIYPFLNTGGSQLIVNIGNIRSIRVTILGEAVRPGTYTISSLSSVFNALYAAGGPNIDGTYRAIEVVRGSRIVHTIDIYDFLLKGIQSNFRLQDQDVINIPVYQTRVKITGQVKRQGLFEILPSESLADLLRFAGGYSSRAYTASMKVLTNTARELRVNDIPSAAFTSYHPANGDEFEVQKILNRYENRVSISGAVFRPGRYALDDGLTLRGLIQKADGLREDAFQNNAYLSRLKVDNNSVLISFNIGDLMNGKVPDIKLMREDSIIIPSIFDLRDQYRIEVQGEVRHPGVFRYSENINLESALEMAGGLKEGATAKSIEISRRVKNSDRNASNAISAQIFNVDVDDNFRNASSSFILQPFDVISVRSAEGYEVQRIVKIEGEVLSPGIYTIQRKDEKISDIIKRAGGLTTRAFIEGASLRRPGPNAKNQLEQKAVGTENNVVNKTDQDQLRLSNLQRLQKLQAQNVDTTNLRQDPSVVRSDYVGIRLTKIMEEPGSHYDLLVEDGDVISVPKVLQTVRVSGEVLKPANVVYSSGKSLADYVRESGGFTNDAKKGGAYVEYANGSMNSTRHIIFFRDYPDIKPGAEIFIPKRQPKNPLSTQAVVGIASALASIAVVIVALFR